MNFRIVHSREGNPTQSVHVPTLMNSRYKNELTKNQIIYFRSHRFQLNIKRQCQLRPIMMTMLLLWFYIYSIHQKINNNRMNDSRQIFIIINLNKNPCILNSVWTVNREHRTIAMHMFGLNTFRLYMFNVEYWCICLFIGANELNIEI